MLIKISGLRICCCFVFLLVIGLKISHHFLIQSGKNQNQLAHVSRALHRIHVFASSFDRNFLDCLCPLLFGQSDNFGFRFRVPQLKTAFKLIKTKTDQR